MECIGGFFSYHVFLWLNIFYKLELQLIKQLGLMTWLFILTIVVLQATSWFKIKVKLFDFTRYSCDIHTSNNMYPLNQCRSKLIGYWSPIWWTEGDISARNLAPTDLINFGVVTPFGDRDLGNIGRGNGLLPDSTKPLPQPVLIYFQWGLVAFTRGQFHTKCWRYLLWLSHEGNFTGNAEDIYPWCKVCENYLFMITAESPRYDGPGSSFI